MKNSVFLTPSSSLIDEMRVLDQHSVKTGGNVVTRLVEFGDRREVTASGMKVRHGGVVDLHGERERKQFERGTRESRAIGKNF
jgi:hypothetical protein